MTKVITITILSAVVLLAGAAVVLAQTTPVGTGHHYSTMPVWGDGVTADTSGENRGPTGFTDSVTGLQEACIDAFGDDTARAEEHWQEMESHMQDGAWQDHMGDGAWQDHMGDYTDRSDHMSQEDWQEMEQAMDEHMGDGTWQDHMDGTGSGSHGYQGEGQGPTASTAPDHMDVDGTGYNGHLGGSGYGGHMGM
jgi:hypothetical protein